MHPPTLREHDCGDLFGKWLSEERQRAIQEKVTFPEEEELMGRTEMDSPAPQVKSYFLLQICLINATLTGELTLQEKSFSCKIKICSHEYICLAETSICVSSLHACLETDVEILFLQRRYKIRQFLDTYQNIL